MPVSIVLGVIVALLRNTLFDRVANVVTLTSISSPEFFLGYILILYLAVKTNYFPAIASLSADMSFGDLLHRTFLPALTLVLVVTAHMMRMTRAAIINLLASPYIEMARLKGVPPWKVIVKHALPTPGRRSSTSSHSISPTSLPAWFWWKLSSSIRAWASFWWTRLPNAISRSCRPAV